MKFGLSDTVIKELQDEYKSQVARMLNEKGSAYLIEQTKQFREWILQKCSHVTKLSDSSDNTSK